MLGSNRQKPEKKSSAPAVHEDLTMNNRIDSQSQFNQSMNTASMNNLMTVKTETNNNLPKH